MKGSSLLAGSLGLGLLLIGCLWLALTFEETTVSYPPMAGEQTGASSTVSNSLPGQVTDHVRGSSREVIEPPPQPEGGKRAGRGEDPVDETAQDRSEPAASRRLVKPWHAFSSAEALAEDRGVSLTEDQAATLQAILDDHLPGYESAAEEYGKLRSDLLGRKVDRGEFAYPGDPRPDVPGTVSRSITLPDGKTRVVVKIYPYEYPELDSLWSLKRDLHEGARSEIGSFFESLRSRKKPRKQEGER